MVRTRWFPVIIRSLILPRCLSTVKAALLVESDLHFLVVDMSDESRKGVFEDASSIPMSLYFCTDAGSVGDPGQGDVVP